MPTKGIFELRKKRYESIFDLKNLLQMYIKIKTITCPIKILIFMQQSVEPSGKRNLQNPNFVILFGTPE